MTGSRRAGTDNGAGRTPSDEGGRPAVTRFPGTRF
jgi:hypothetical protein